MDVKMQYMVLLCAIMSGIQGVAVDPCLHHYFLTDTDLRGQQCHLYDVGTGLCDRLSIQNKKWFVAKLNGLYLEMPMTCPSPYACDTSGPVWLNGTHPNSTEGIVEREFCVRGIYDEECCQTSISARIKNCDSYFVYELTRAKCDYAYCFGNHKCPASVYIKSTIKPLVEASDETSISPTEIAMYAGIATVTFLTILIVVILILKFTVIESLRKVNAMKNDKKQHTEPDNPTIRDNGSPPQPYTAYKKGDVCLNA